MADIALIDTLAEANVISGCMLQKGMYPEARSRGLKAVDFNGSVYSVIYETIGEMYEDGEAVDPHTLLARLQVSGSLDICGGEAGIKRLANMAEPEAGYIPSIGIVLDRATRRSARDVFELGLRGLHIESDIGKLIADTSMGIADLGAYGGTQSGRGTTLADMVSRSHGVQPVADRIEYPFASLNRIAHGRQRGTLSIWGGYTSDGKSTLAVDSSCYSAAKKIAVGLFCLEMTDEEMYWRILSHETGIDPTSLEMGMHDLDQLATIQAAEQRISKWDLKVFDNPDITPDEIRSIQLREKFDLVIIDYLQEFDWSDVHEIPRIAKTFKKMSNKTRCATDLLSQLLVPTNVGYGKNPYTKPTEYSLFGGRQISNVASNIFYIWAQRTQDPEGAWVRTGNGRLLCSKARGGKTHFDFPVVFDVNRLCWREP